MSIQVENYGENAPLLPVTSWTGAGQEAAGFEADMPPTETDQEPVERKVEVTVKERLVSLDSMRGLTIWFMNLVNNAGDPQGYAILDHAAWNGLTIADFVMPFFLFMVGASTAFAYHRPLEQGVSKWSLLQKALVRAAKLFVIGILIGNSVPYNLAHIRIMGVLQRISICYIIVSICVIFIPKLPYRGKYFRVLPTYALQFLVPVVILTVYMIVVYKVPLVAGCPESDRFKPNCNVVGWLDAQILRPDHMYSRPTCLEAVPPCPYFDPEGLTSTFVAVVSVFIGLYFGYFIPLYKANHRARLLHWGATSVILLALGLGLGLTKVIPLNKNLYSLSYILVTGGAAGICLMLFYVVQDMLMIRKPLLPLTWLGMNSIILYVGDMMSIRILGNPSSRSGYIYWQSDRTKDSDKYTLFYWLFHAIFDHMRRPAVAFLLWGLFHAMIWILPAWLLWRKKIFVKV